MKKLLFTLVLLIGFQVVSKAQCNVPTNIKAVSTLADSVTFVWNGSVSDTFEIEYWISHFTQGTGIQVTTVYDTTVTFKFSLKCKEYGFYIRKKCGSTFSNWAGPVHIYIPPPPGGEPNGVFNLDFKVCGDSLYPQSSVYPFAKGFKFGNNYWKKPKDLPTSYSILGNSYGFIYADGDQDTIMSYFSPYINFTGGTQAAVFFHYSNNVTTPGDNVTLNVHIDNKDTIYKNVYTYSGDNANWEKVFIDLAPYHSNTTNVIRLIFEVDQSTATTPKWNDFLIDHLYVGDSTYCSTQNLMSFSRPTPNDILIERINGNNISTTYQYGPSGFTPNVGQTGIVTTNSDSTYISAVPPGTDWVYIKDSCIGIDIHKLPKWNGPFYIDSTYTYRIYGNYIADLNNNCTWDAADYSFKNKAVHLTPGNKMVWIDKNGGFEFFVDSGNYAVSSYYFPINSGCYSRSIYINTDSLNQLHQNLYVEKATLYSKFSVNIKSPNRILQGDTLNIGFFVRNHSPTLSDSSIISYKIDTSSISIVSQNGWVYNSSTKTYTKTIAPISALSFYNELNSFQVRAKIGAKYFNLPSKLTVKIDTLFGVNLTNISKIKDYKYVFSVTSIDPNDKQMSPSAKTLIKDSILQFRIRFQNTGNYPASQVIVLDTLPQFLDSARFELIETSHNCMTTIDSNHVVKFKFYNINLPDSTTDFEGSQGYIDFAMHLNSTMQIGDTMANRAHIFFDYQPAVITNWAWIKVIDTCDLLIPKADFVYTIDSVNPLGAGVSFSSVALNAINTTWDFGDGVTDTGTATQHIYLTNGNYTATQIITNFCGVKDSLSQPINISGIDTCQLILPAANFTSTFNTLTTQGFSMNFNSTALNAIYTSWAFGDGSIDTGNSVTHLYQSNGSYKVLQTVVNSCGTQDTASQQIVVQGISIEEYLDPQFKVYPNPAQQKITVESLTKEPLDIVIYDVTGRTVFTNNMVGGKKVIDISGLPAGSYMLKLVSPAGELKGMQMIQLQE